MTGKLHTEGFHDFIPQDKTIWVMKMKMQKTCSIYGGRREMYTH